MNRSASPKRKVQLQNCKWREAYNCRNATLQEHGECLDCMVECMLCHRKALGGVTHILQHRMCEDCADHADIKTDGYGQPINGACEHCQLHWSTKIDRLLDRQAFV